MRAKLPPRARAHHSQQIADGQNEKAVVLSLHHALIAANRQEKEEHRDQQESIALRNTPFYASPSSPHNSLRSIGGWELFVKFSRLKDERLDITRSLSLQ